MLSLHLFDHAFQSWRWRQNGLRNLSFQQPNYTAQQLRKPLLWCSLYLHRVLN